MDNIVKLLRYLEIAATLLDSVSNDLETVAPRLAGGLLRSGLVMWHHKQQCLPKVQKV